MVQYTTKAGDMLDAICFQYYGESRGYTEAVREANPDLAMFGPVLPEGVIILLPDLLELDIQQNSIRLWN